MSDYKLISYEAGKINVPKFINEYLNKEAENKTCKYLIFAQTDIIDNAYNIDEVAKKYVGFLNKWNMPFGYYSYYGRFNRVLPTISNIPNPVYVFKINGDIVDVTNQLAIGFLIIDVENINSKNIRLNESYPEIFYLQDFAEKCYKADLWKSNCFFFDINESWKMFKNQDNSGYPINIKNFVDEKNRYNENKPEYKPINFFVEELKKIYNPVKVEG